MPKKETPKGVLDGLAKSFLGVPHSDVLNTAEQTLQQQVIGNNLVRGETSLMTRQSDRSMLAAQRAFFEIQATRIATQDGVAASESVQRAVQTSNDHLSRIEDTLGNRLPEITSGLQGLIQTTKITGGLPESQLHIDELLQSGRVVEAEIIILAMGGGLKQEETRRLFQNLSPWKQDIIESGLVNRYDAKMERVLRPQEMIFLAELRRFASRNISSFRSLEPLARYHLLDDDVHFKLAKTDINVRTSNGELIHGVNELTVQGVVLEQLTKAGLLVGQSTLSEARNARAGIDELVRFEQIAQKDRGETRRASQSTAENSMIIARGVAAHLQLTQHSNHQLDNISSATAGTHRNTQLLATFVQRANEIAEANHNATLEIAGSTHATAEGVGTLVEIGKASLKMEGLHLEFAERAEYGRQIMIEELKGIAAISEGISDGIDNVVRNLDLTIEEIAALHLTLIQNGQIANANLEATEQGNSLLRDILALQNAHHAELIDQLEKIDSGMEHRFRHENRARAQERYEEGLLSYKFGDIESAIRAFTKSIEKWSNEYKVYFIRAICYALSGIPQKAEKDFHSAIQRVGQDNPRERANIKLHLAKLYYSESKIYYENEEDFDLGDDRLVKAIIIAKEATIDAADSDEALLALAVYLAAFKLYEESSKVLIQIIKRNPKFIRKIYQEPELTVIIDNTIQVYIEINPIKFLQLKIWEIQEVSPIKSHIATLIKKAIKSYSNQPPLHCYALAILALYFRSDCEEISDFEVFDAFLAGAKFDLDFEAKNKTAVRNKLQMLSINKASEILDLNSRHSKGFEWLN